MVLQYHDAPPALGVLATGTSSMFQWSSVTHVGGDANGRSLALAMRSAPPAGSPDANLSCRLSAANFARVASLRSIPLNSWSKYAERSPLRKQPERSVNGRM